MKRDLIKLDPAIVDNLQCPICGSELLSAGAALQCEGTPCLTSFPIIDGIPVLINEQNSVFTIDDFLTAQKRSLAESDAPTRMRAVEERIGKLLPTLNRKRKDHEAYGEFAQLIAPQPGREIVRILVLGAGPDGGNGIASLAETPGIHLIETDVAFGRTTTLVCDAHDIPFRDETFDGVIVQAVLEHVADPYRCVHEIHRVLKPNGLVYAETPFMQQVHMGPYDFTRFTDLGHRRLFRQFAEVDRGIASGPGVALAWSYQYFLMSFARSRIVRGILKALARLTSFCFQYLDRYAVATPAAFDAASGFYFVGRKSDRILSDRELIGDYRGAIWAGARSNDSVGPAS